MARRTIFQITLAGMILASAGSLTACSTLDGPTAFSQKKVEVVEETFRAEFDTAKLDASGLSQIADHYSNHGEGPVDIIVTYNPKATGNTAMRASDNAARIAAMLRKAGVKNVNTEILPIHQSETSMTIVSYLSYRAQAPEGCLLLETLDDSRNENFRKYQLGCSSESFIAQQVARPADLLGRANTEEAGARKHANTLDVYKAISDVSTDIETESSQ